MTTAEDMRATISKLATICDNNDGMMKCLTFQEFVNSEDIHKPILNLINKSKKMIILTGAGISCNAGIPDFRSETGLYNKKVTDGKVMKGKEMFDISVYRSIDTVIAFNRFIHELYQQVLESRPTRTHEFIKKLQERGKLIKCYTQNIDGLERECGLKTEFECIDGNTNKDEWKDIDVVQLHGDLHQLCCNSCKHSYRWDEVYDGEGKCKMISRDDKFNELESEGDEDMMILSQVTNNSETSESIFSSKGDDDASISSEDVESVSSLERGALIECPKCIEQYESRVKMGKRSLESSIGIIRPNIVLYGEEHPHSESFAKNLMKDLNKKPNIMIIFGTSLKVNGVKNLVRRMAQKVHESEKGVVILVNKDVVAPSQWKKYIDYQIVSDCDAFCEFIERGMPDL